MRSAGGPGQTWVAGTASGSLPWPSGRCLTLRAGGVMSANETPSGSGEPVPAWIERRTATTRQRDVEFDDPRLEYRRLFSEVWGTFLLVLVAAGGGVIGATAFGSELTLQMKALAPRHDGDGGHLFHGHHQLAPISTPRSPAFAVRGNFPWRRVPGYIGVQVIGAVLAGLVPAADVRRDHQRRHRADPRRQHLGGDADRGRAHPRAGQCHPGHRFGCPERRDRTAIAVVPTSAWCRSGGAGLGRR